MGNQVTKGERLLQAASQGDTHFVHECMAQVDTRGKLLLKSKTGFLHHNEGVLHLAAKRGQLHALTAVLGPIVDAVTLEIAEGQYPGPSAQLLTQLVNQTDSRGRTPFLTACHHGHWDCAEQLLEAGSNIFAVDRDGNSCLHLAAVHSHTEVVSQLLTKAAAEAVTLRLTSIINLSGFTPLHYAAHAGNAEITRQLLAAGVDPLQGSVADYDRWLVVPQGTTALHVAAMSQQSGVCIMLLQHYALQLREWLPGDPTPVDPRTRIDNSGATPLNVALWKGLTPNSQLAICLNPRLDVLSVFSDQQLDDVRRKGPQPLKVLAAAAVKCNLLQQLTQLADQQQQLVLMQKLERQQQQQRRSKQQQQQQQQQRQKGDVQRWWRSRRSTDFEAPAAAAGSSPAVQGYVGSSNGSNSQRTFDSPFYHSSAADVDPVPGSSSSSSKAAIKPADQPNGSSSSSSAAVGSSSSNVQGSSSEDQVDDFFQGLKRTPSITLGAMLHTHDIDNHHHQQQQQLQQTSKKKDLASTAAAAAAAAVPAEIEAAEGAPAGPLKQHTADVDHSAAAASGSSSSSHSSPSRKLHSSSSITLGCLDQVWKHSEQQEELHGEDAANKQRQQQQQTSEVGPMEAATQQQQQHHLMEQSSEIEADCGADHHQHQQQQQQQQEQQQEQQQQQQSPQLSRPQSRLSQISTGSAAAAAADGGASEADSYKHINEHIHKAMGCTKSFQLVTPSATGSSSSSSACEGDGDHAAAGSDPQQQQQQQIVPTTPKQQQEQHIRQRSLGVASITLAQLHRNGSSSGSSSVAGDAGNGSSVHNGFRSNGGSNFSKHGGQTNKVLTTAGIQNQQVMTPFALRLFQQQQKGYAAAAAAAKIQQNFCLLPAAASTASSSSSRLKVAPNPRSSLQSFYQTSHSSSHPTSQFRSPHRRSFEVHGHTGSSMSAVFGASRQHIARMLEEAGAIDARALYQSLASKGSIAVATSLAGALPGCVSTKLVQCVDLERTSSLPHGLPSSSPVGLSQPPSSLSTQHPSLNPALGSTVGSTTGPRRSSSIVRGGSVGGSNLNANRGEICAICCDRVPTVAVSRCGHTMCFECVRVIVQEGVGCRAPLCPFCRVNITGFRLAAGATAAPTAGVALQHLALT